LYTTLIKRSPPVPRWSCLWYVKNEKKKGREKETQVSRQIGIETKHFLLRKSSVKGSGTEEKKLLIFLRAAIAEI